MVEEMAIPDEWLTQTSTDSYKLVAHMEKWEANQPNIHLIRYLFGPFVVAAVSASAQPKDIHMLFTYYYYHLQ